MKIKKLDEEFDYGKDDVNIVEDIPNGVAYNNYLKHRREYKETMEKLSSDSKKIADDINDRRKGINDEMYSKMKKMHLMESLFESESTNNEKGIIWDESTKTLTFTKDVKEITDEMTYSYCNKVKKVIIPDSVTSINKDAFYSCSSLTSITIPDSVTSIGRDAFRNCFGLTSVTIPTSVTSISRDAFFGCNNLINVYYAGSEEQWSNIKVGDYNGNLLNANIHFNNKNESLNEANDRKYFDLTNKIYDKIYEMIKGNGGILDNIAIVMKSEIPEYEADYASKKEDPDIEYKVRQLASAVSRDLMNNYKLRIVNEATEIEVENPGLLEVPEGKRIDQLPFSHFQKLVDKKGYDKIIRGLNNIAIWNKNDDKKLSAWAKNMMEKLKKKHEKNKNESPNEDGDDFYVEDDEWSKRYDEKFGAPKTEVFAPGEIQKFLQEVVKFE